MTLSATLTDNSNSLGISGEVLSFGVGGLCTGIGVFELHQEFAFAHLLAFVDKDSLDGGCDQSASPLRATTRRTCSSSGQSTTRILSTKDRGPLRSSSSGTTIKP